MVDPRDHAHLYLGAANGWLYQSHNNGANWTRLARVGKRDDLALDSMVIDPQDPKHIVVGAWAIGGHDGGVFISYDAGVNWISQAEMRGQSVLSLADSRSNPKLLVAGTLKGVFRSVDGGQRWKQISPADSVEIHNVESVALDPTDPNIIYAGTWHLPWKSTDGGEHWDNIKDGIIDDSDVFSIIVDPKVPSVVFASACSGIYKSVNAGEHFEKVQGIPSSARRTRILLQDPNHLETVFAGTTEGLFRSDDAGKTWTRTTGPEIIVNDVSIDPADSRHVLIATDRGGVLSSDDGGDTFHASNGGFSARQIIAMVRDRNHPATLFVGVVNDKEWGGIFESDNGGLAWSQKSEGLQGRDVFALGQATDGTIVAGTGHGLFLFDTAAGTWKKVEEAPSDIVGTVAPKAVSMNLRPPVAIQRSEATSTRGAKTRVVRGRRVVAAKTKAKPGKTRGKAAPVVTRRAKALAAKKKTAGRAVRTSAHQSAPAPKVKVQPVVIPVKVADKPVAVPTVKGFDGSVLGIVTSGDKLLAATSLGLMSSGDNGSSWQLANVPGSADWRYFGSAGSNVIAASLHEARFSADSGASWSPIRVPEQLNQIAAIAVEPSGTIWIGGREGIFVSSDAGDTWTTPKNLYITDVVNLFYDEPGTHMLVTTGGPDSVVFSVHVPDRKIDFAYSGWSLRFARPVGNHIVGATLFDGMVVQPKMMDAPPPPTATAKQ